MGVYAEYRSCLLIRVERLMSPAKPEGKDNDVEELLAKRGIIVTYETVRQAVAAGDGQVEKLQCRSPDDDALRGSQYGAV